MINEMNNTLSFLNNRKCQFEPKDLFPSTDMTQVENEISAQDNLHRHLPHLLSERMLDIGKCDKVFASKWLSEDVFILGTKTNQLLLVDLSTNELFELPLLLNKDTSLKPEFVGIHSIQISFDGQYLATGGASANEISVYKLPELTPYILGQGHKDLIFDIAWISDDIFVTGSRDSSMAVWKVPDITTLLVEERLLLSSLMTPWPMSYPLAEHAPKMDMLFGFTNLPSRTFHGNKVRSLTCNRNTKVLASLQASPCESSTNFWDFETFKKLCSVEMPYCSENVCLELHPEYNLYAIGSRSHVSLIDGRLTNEFINYIRSRDPDSGVRSLQFKNEIISIGSGGGNVFFYDLRAANYLPSNKTYSTSSQELCSLNTTCGWVRNDSTYRDFFSNVPHPPNAIYTHQYSPSSSRMLLAGGPLPLGLYGNYCSIWS